MSQHTPTPGPWFPERNERRFNVWGRRGELLVADCGREENLFSEANARLIAAAPDLLQLAFQYRDYLRHPPSPDSRERRLAAIDAAIAKAEGRFEPNADLRRPPSPSPVGESRDGLTERLMKALESLRVQHSPPQGKSINQATVEKAQEVVRAALEAAKGNMA